MNRKGFTLLEMVVAVTILAVISGIVAGAIRLASASIDRGESEVARSARLKAAIDFVERTVRSADPTPIPVGDNTTAFFRGEPDKVRFLSLAPAAPGGEKTFRLVCLLKAGERGADGLAIADAPPFRQDGAWAWETAEKARVLLPGADAVAFSYSPGPSESGTWEWTDAWDSRAEGRVPAAVRVEFTMPGDGAPLKTSLVIPVLSGGGGS